jgi:hypothetical protein
VPDKAEASVRWPNLHASGSSVFSSHQIKSLMVNVFKELPWLKVKDGHLFCSACINAG